MFYTIHFNDVLNLPQVSLTNLRSLIPNGKAFISLSRMKGRTTDVAKLVEDLPSTAALVMVSDIHLFACAIVWTGIFSYKSFPYVGKEWRGG